MNWVSEKSKLAKQRHAHYRSAQRDAEIQRRRHPKPVSKDGSILTPKRLASKKRESND